MNIYHCRSKLLVFFKILDFRLKVSIEIRELTRVEMKWWTCWHPGSAHYLSISHLQKGKVRGTEGGKSLPIWDLVRVMRRRLSRRLKTGRMSERSHHGSNSIDRFPSRLPMSSHQPCHLSRDPIGSDRLKIHDARQRLRCPLHIPSSCSLNNYQRLKDSFMSWVW